MKTNRFKFNAKTVFVVIALLLAANAVLGLYCVTRARATIRRLINERMLGVAGSGQAMVDDIAVSDKWGKYYSAYSPVFTSGGEVGGIVGVDFDAEWYEHLITENTVLILLVDAVSLLAGGGDEFIAVLPDFTQEDMAAAFEKLDEEIRRTNANDAKSSKVPVSFSKGDATFLPGQDREFREVFRRADQKMYRNKGAYYERSGNQTQGT